MHKALIWTFLGFLNKTGNHLGPKYLSDKHFSSKTSTAFSALALTYVLISPFCSRRVCGRDIRHSVVMATESYVQPVHKPYITLCQGHRLCSTYKWVYWHHNTLLYTRCQKTFFKMNGRISLSVRWKVPQSLDYKNVPSSRQTHVHRVLVFHRSGSSWHIFGFNLNIEYFV